MRKIVFAAPFVVIALVALVTMTVLAVIGQALRRRWLSHRVLKTWPAGKVALLSYTTSAKWSSYLETSVIPLIENHCVVLDRSDAQWKEKNPLAARLIGSYGGGLSANALAIVIRRGGWPKVFFLYEPLQKARMGDNSALEEMSANLREAMLHESQRAV
jgi:hypothetical protein